MKTPILFAAVAAASLALGGCASSGGYGYAGDGYRDGRGYDYDQRCNSCGVVERIEVSRYGDGGTTGAGAVAGALVGAAIGNQVGSGDGRRAATVAGAVAGGVAGHRIEESRNERDVFAIQVRMDDGRSVIVEQRSLDGVREGARVSVRNGRANLL